MLPLAHIGFAILFSSLLYLPIAAAAFGAVVPDVIDKLFFAAGMGLCGRFVAHTIFFGPIISAVAFAITRRKDVAAAVLLGAFLHLLMDARAFIPWMYPIVSYNFSCAPTVVRPDVLDMAMELSGALLIPIVLALRPRLNRMRLTMREAPKI